MHAATSKVENSAQGSSCKLKFVHALSFDFGLSTVLVIGCVGYWTFYGATTLSIMTLSIMGFFATHSIIDTYN
jgi:hypothetical protein